MSLLLDKSRSEIKLGNYAVAPATALADSSILPRVQEYRRHFSSRMSPLDGDDIRQKISKADYHVSRKVDGEFTVLVYRDGELLTVNPGGTVRIGLPWQEEAKKVLSDAGHDEVILAGELYVENENRRSRVHDVVTTVRHPENEGDLNRIRFAIFDIISLDDGYHESPYGEKWLAINKLFKDSKLVHPVECEIVKNADAVAKLYRKWVEKNGAEGLVVRSDSAGIFKIKPRHNLDAVVIGFTESVGDRQGMLHDLLVAIMRHDRTLQVLTRVGGGFSDDERRSLLSDLKDLSVESEYAEVNSDHVAYQMVRPTLVVELSCLDLISETTRGGPVNRMVLQFREDDLPRYEVVRRLPLAAVISPQFIRVREDKSANYDEIRIEQISQRVEVPMVDRDAGQMTLPKSEILRRSVYTKTARGQMMVRKFLAWKTNKETDSPEHPAFVLHYTDFSPNRKEPLSREVRVSSSVEQIHTFFDQMIEANIKKGWELHSTTDVEKQSVADSKKTIAVPKQVPDKAQTRSEPKKKKAIKVKMAPSEHTAKRAAKKKSG